MAPSGKSLRFIILLALPLAVFSFSLSYPLLDGWDDHIYVGDGSHLALNSANLAHWLSSPCEGCYLPITMLSYMLDHLIWGLNPIGYRLQNLFWHILAVFAVYKCMLRFGINPWVSLFLSAAFAVHPQRVESVVWISERKDVLCAAFYFWSFYFFISGKEDEKRFPLRSFALFLCAMLSKPMAISLPLVMLVHEYFIAGRRGYAMLLKRLCPFFALSAIFLPISYFSQTISYSGDGFLRRLLSVFHNLAWYFRKTLVPGQLAPIYPEISPGHGMSIKIAIVIAFLSYLAFSLWKKNRDLFQKAAVPFFLSFCIALAPVAGFVPLGAIDYADRYSYIPSAFLWMLIGVYITAYLHLRSDGAPEARFIYRKPVFSIVFGSVYILSMALMSCVYSAQWRSYGSILRASAAHVPPSFMALGALADLELANGNFDQAEHAADMIIARKPGFESKEGYGRIVLKAQCIKAVSLFHKGMKKEASTYFETVRRSSDKSFFSDDANYQNFIRMADESLK